MKNMKSGSKAEDALFEGLLTAPDFPEEMDWLNTDEPLRMKDLKGKIVLLDFWTYCCINCMHIIPDLKRLEREFPNELMVIGVHSAKFLTEKETENIYNAVQRYEIKHPVVNDNEMEIWSTYGVHAWPTLVLINPLGKIIGSVSGEGIYDVFLGLISDTADYFRKKSLLNNKPLNLIKNTHQSSNPLLSFPGKVLADEKDHLLFISDSNHNRIIGMNLKDNSVKFVVGSGEEGWRDGGFDDAQFNHPQGLAYDSNARILYIADTENHLIRKINLESQMVETIAGTGHQGGFNNRISFPLETGLNSPWDIVLLHNQLYIAMAGSHQIWKLDIIKNELSRFAGSGREALIDGHPLRAALAQPSGITTDGETLYFTDSETSSIRSLDLHPEGEVKTIVGRDLFVFGDRDGSGDTVRLQHPLGVTFYKNKLYIADTYNNKIKEIDPIQRTAAAICGNGNTGHKDGKSFNAELNEPGGITAAFDKLYIADTNNHVVRIYDPDTAELSTIYFANPEKLVSKRIRLVNSRTETERVLMAGASDISINIVLPTDCKINLEAPSFIKLTSSDSDIFSFGNKNLVLLIKQPDLNFKVKADAFEGKTHLKIEALIYYCRENAAGGCLVLADSFTIPLKIIRDSGEKIIEINIQD